MKDVELRNADCFDVLDKMINSGFKVDAIITDPPYEFKKGGFGGGNAELSKRSLKADINNEKLHQEFSSDLLDKFKQVQDKVNIVMFGTEEMMFKATEWARENKYYYTWTVWNKTNPTPLCNNRYLNSTEWIIHIREKGVKIHGNYHSKQKVYTSSVNKKDKKEFNHATIKPIELMDKYIQNHSEENQTIFDPFMGSGSTGISAINNNRKFIGVEMDSEYFETAKNRIESCQ